MNGIEFEKMTDSKKKEVYNTWKNKKMPHKICKVWDNRYPEPSNNSYMFDIDGINSTKIVKSNEKVLRDNLKKIFKLNNVVDYDKKFHNAFFGAGHEYKEVLRLHSSALCAFLFFSSVSVENPLELTLEFDKPGCLFKEVRFEYENNVFKDGHPSSVDVVLLTEDKKTILFLESKFAEYYLSNHCIEVSAEYLGHDMSKRFYNRETLESFGFRSNYVKNEIKTYDSDGRKVFKVYSDKSDISNAKSYVDGIKQMISHYIGVDNFIRRECSLPKDVKVFLGEILFDFKNEKIEKYMKDYEDKYNKLYNLFKNTNHNIHWVDRVLHYSDIEGFVKNQTIKEFYFGK